MNREKLEAAAKAVGYEIATEDGVTGELLVDCTPPDWNRLDLKVWNPYTSDGDLFRLAWECDMNLDLPGCTVGVPILSAKPGTWRYFGFERGDRASLADAVLDAAIEYGRGK